MTATTGATTLSLLLAAHEECGRARRWYRLTCSDADTFAEHAAWAMREGQLADARAYAQRGADANRARRAAWAEYRGAVARLTQVVGGRGA